jgi:hypothetical protein
MEEFGMKWITVLLGAALFCGCATQKAEKETKTVKVLAVGNSFSQNALKYFDEIVEASGNRTVSQNCMIGGCSLERHVRHLKAYEADPSDPEGSPYPDDKSLKDLLTQEKWDVVTVQQVSAMSYKPETFHPYIDELMAYIKQYAPQAEIVLHQTWAYREDHSFWGADLDTDRMYAALRKALDGLAAELDLRMIPCGDAFETARQDPAWGKFVPDESFDREAAVYPEVPNEKNSLHNWGWWKTKDVDEPVLMDDRFHANKQGEYLLGCVWFEFLFGESVIGNSFVPEGVTEEEAATLQRIAHQVVTEGIRP